MTPAPPFDLARARTRVTIRPDEGGAAVGLAIDGMPVLARTPWHAEVEPSSVAADDEPDWVRRWRGGWQLCFPTAGRADPESRPRQSFHGTASQTPWSVESRTGCSATLTWEDESGLCARRTWEVLADGLRASTTAHNAGEHARTVIVAEHLILGGDLIAPLLDGHVAARGIDPQTAITELDYEGVPTGRRDVWPGAADDRWPHVSATTPARVVALTPPSRTGATLSVAGRQATVTWEGLDHVLVWEELASSQEHPWDGRVVAVGIEPTSTPHGAGTAAGGGIDLAPGGEIRWSTTLRVTASAHENERGESP